MITQCMREALFWWGGLGFLQRVKYVDTDAFVGVVLAILPLTTTVADHCVHGRIEDSSTKKVHGQKTH